MKKLLIIGALLMLLSSGAMARSTMKAGLGEILLGWDTYRDGHFESTMGVNWLLGFTYKRYFNYVRYNDWNPYWHAGTVAIVAPYAGVGVDYLWDNGWFAGAGTYLLVPQIHAGFTF